MRGRKVAKGKRFSVPSILIALFIVSLCLYSAYFLFSFFNIKNEDPLGENLSSHKILSTIDDDLEKTLLVFEKGEDTERGISEVYALLYNKRKNTSLVIYLPGGLYFSGLEENFGSPIAISSLRYAGDYLQKGRGVEYTIWQLSEILGFKFDNYVWLTTEGYAIFEDIYNGSAQVTERSRGEYISEGTLSDSFFKMHNFSDSYNHLSTFLNIKKLVNSNESIYSNLSFASVLGHIDNYKYMVGSSDTYSMELGSLQYSIESLAEQGGQFRSINVAEYDRGIQKYVSKLQDRDLEKERVRVEVYNASTVSGRAALYARKISNSGCDVVRFGNAPSHLEKTVVFISNKESFKNSFDIVSEVLSGRFEEISERPSFMTTGDIVILLGEDISQVEIF